METPKCFTEFNELFSSVKFGEFVFVRYPKESYRGDSHHKTTWIIQRGGKYTKCESDVDATVSLVRVWEFALFGQFGDYLVSEKLSVKPKSVLTVG